jgi:hypothetical protein
MSQCEFLGKCAFYNDSIKDKQEVGHFIKQLCCLQESQRCNRLKCAGGRDVGDTNYTLTPWGLEFQ